MKIRRKRQLHNGWFLSGLIAAACLFAPYLILGEDAVFVSHDQLDGEMIAYILQAKHLFAGKILPEFMGGADKTALTMPAPGFVLLFLGGKPFWALAVMQLLGSLCGYVGMYLLSGAVLTGNSEKMPERKAICALTAALYAYLPFLPVYGLSQYGIPLLVWCFLRLGRGNGRFFSKNNWPLWGYITLYTLCSSLALVGFGVLGAIFLWAVLLQFGKKRPAKHLWAAFGWMAILYGALNFRLIGQIFAGGVVSHKAEYALNAENFFTGLLSGLLEGGQHSQDFHKWILAAALLTAFAAFVTGTWKKREERRLLSSMGICLGINFILAFGAALWNSGAGVALRTHMEALGAFQVQRLLWLAPCFWYLIAACMLDLAWRTLKGMKEKSGALRKIIRGFAAAFCIGALGVTAMTVLLGSNLKPNLQKLRNPDYGMLSYSEYYALGVMNQVEDFIRENTGQEPEDYRVVSLGIDPAAALYQGFYCLDGYSNNYALEYKHAFRKVIAPELAKSAYLQEYFDDWGNRCYLFSAEAPAYYTIEKGGFFFREYALDVEALKALGGKYLLSAAYIANAKEQGLQLLREEPFETSTSYYRIFLYELL